MRFRFPIEFDIPDEWWNQTKASDFRPLSRAYNAKSPDYELLTSPNIRVVPIERVKPPRRRAGVELLQRDRMIQILAGFVAGHVLPAVEAYEPSSAGFSFSVRNGFHRFYGSCAIGFTHLPVVVWPKNEFDYEIDDTNNMGT